MAALLAGIWRGEILGNLNRNLLLDVMARCDTGTDRIKGMLPGSVTVAHKTGTIGSNVNDVGIMTLPDEAGHVALVIFVSEPTDEMPIGKESDLAVPIRERAIAHMARAIHDYFLFRPRH